MKISVTTDEGTLVDQILDPAINLSSTLARANLWNELVELITRARKIDADEARARKLRKGKGKC